jgi:hypothetical protein
MVLGARKPTLSFFKGSTSGIAHDCDDTCRPAVTKQLLLST